jgi:hypothetical protein
MNRLKAAVVAVCGLIAGGLTSPAFPGENAHVNETIKHAKESLKHAEESLTHAEQSAEKSKGKKSSLWNPVNSH